MFAEKRDDPSVDDTTAHAEICPSVLLRAVHHLIGREPQKGVLPRWKTLPCRNYLQAVGVQRVILMVDGRLALRFRKHDCVQCEMKSDLGGEDPSDW